MMRVLIKLLLSICVLLLGGYALSCHNTTGYYPKKVFDKSPHIHYTCSRYEEAQVSKTPPPKTKKGREKIKAIEIEEEDEDPTLFRKYSETGNTLIAFINTHIPTSVYPSFEGALPFCEHFSYFSSYKFIIHLVIRI
ncbi:hypothetical protein [uncultured Chitinophaga sp.]|jgi:hypothetical protein|uniref:hypothetical protein n=1 Tax=uncultured Chitinophaga sp. TaxID=339340 RepID=UPI00261AF104|nr:hypothetical protein [uncultured Chitinophaga sp.]